PRVPLAQRDRSSTHDLSAVEDMPQVSAVRTSNKEREISSGGQKLAGPDVLACSEDSSNATSSAFRSTRSFPEAATTPPSDSGLRAEIGRAWFRSEPQRCRSEGNSGRCVVPGPLLEPLLIPVRGERCQCGLVDRDGSGEGGTQFRSEGAIAPRRLERVDCREEALLDSDCLAKDGKDVVSGPDRDCPQSQLRCAGFVAGCVRTCEPRALVGGVGTGREILGHEVEVVDAENRCVEDAAGIPAFVSAQGEQPDVFRGHLLD